MWKDAVLKLSKITKDYPGVKALDNVDMDFLAGEVHALIGENGAGKSTLIKILAGVVKANKGEILLHGKPISISSGRDAEKYGLAFIHQELNLIPYFNAVENIFIGHQYPKNLIGTVSWKKLKKAAQEILNRLQVDIPLRGAVTNLSPGNHAMIAIARPF